MRREASLCATLCIKNVNMTHKYIGGCHCGNITLEMELTGDPGSYYPRACDCEFCRKHGASYLSDPRGKLDIRIRKEADVSTYRQGSGIADFLICKICGVLVGVSYKENGRLYASVNSKTFGSAADFGADAVALLRALDDQDRIQRWKTIWFSDVSIKRVGA